MRSIALYRPVEVESDYVGTTTSWEPYEARAGLQTAKTQRLIAEYGERVSNMLRLYMDGGTDIQIGYGALSMCDGGPEYIVIDVPREKYAYGTVAIVEKVRP